MAQLAEIVKAYGNDYDADAKVVKRHIIDGTFLHGATSSDSEAVLNQYDPNTTHKASTSHFPKEGVRLSVFRNIVKEHGKKIFKCPVDNYDHSQGMCKKGFEELTTTDVCNLIIKPSTAESQLSWCH